MTYNTLIIEKRDGIATLKLNRPDRLNALSVEMARQIAEGPPVAIAISKAMIYQALETSLDIHGRLEFFGQDYCFNTEDREEGIRSFLEKRPPRFRGT